MKTKRIKTVYFRGRYFDVNIAGKSKLYNDNPNEIVIPLKKIRIKFDYPLGGIYTREYKSKAGFSANKLLQIVRKEYSKFFQHPAKFGIWGHSIRDLGLDYLEHQQNNIFTLGISS